MNTDRLYRILLLGLLLLLAAGFVRLFIIRFDTGNIYPPYSSLRSDPLGTRLFFDSLEELEKMDIHINKIPLPEWKPSPEELVFRLGVSPDAFQNRYRNRADALDDFVREGGRLVIALKNEPTRSSEEADNGEKEDPEPTTEDTEPSTHQVDQVSLPWRSWNLQVEPLNARTLTPQQRHAETSSPFDLPFDVWLKLVPDHEDWRILHRIGPHPVAAERSLGEGSVVVLSASYPFSNEAMAQPGHLAGLLELLNGRTRITVDESHLGIRRRTGLANLIYRYKLQGALAALALLTGLYVWRQLCPLVPPYSDRRIEVENAITGADSMDGLTGLMRRHLPASKLAGTLLECYRHTHPVGSARHRQRLTCMEQAVANSQEAQKRSPLDLIQTLHHLAKDQPKSPQPGDPHG